MQGREQEERQLTQDDPHDDSVATYGHHQHDGKHGAPAQLLPPTHLEVWVLAPPGTARGGGPVLKPRNHSGVKNPREV